MRRLVIILAFGIALPLFSREPVAKLQFAHDSDSSPTAHSQRSTSICDEAEPAQTSSGLDSNASFSIGSLENAVRPAQMMNQDIAVLPASQKISPQSNLAEEP